MLVVCFLWCCVFDFFARVLQEKIVSVFTAVLYWLGMCVFSFGGVPCFAVLRKLSRFFVLFLNAAKIVFLLTQMFSFALGLPEGNFSRCLHGFSSLGTARKRFQ